MLESAGDGLPEALARTRSTMKNMFCEMTDSAAPATGAAVGGVRILSKLWLKTGGKKGVVAIQEQQVPGGWTRWDVVDGAEMKLTAHWTICLLDVDVRTPGRGVTWRSGEVVVQARRRRAAIVEKGGKEGGKDCFSTGWW